MMNERYLISREGEVNNGKCSAFKLTCAQPLSEFRSPFNGEHMNKDLYSLTSYCLPLELSHICYRKLNPPSPIKIKWLGLRLCFADHFQSEALTVREYSIFVLESRILTRE